MIFLFFYIFYVEEVRMKYINKRRSGKRTRKTNIVTSNDQGQVDHPKKRRKKKQKWLPKDSQTRVC